MFQIFVIKLSSKQNPDILRMYKLDLPIDLKEQAAIERRRRLEKERQARIFNNKHRLIGVDKNALDQQIQDKLFMEEMERKRHEAFGNNKDQVFFPKF